MKNIKIDEFIESDPHITERYLRAMRSDYAREQDFFRLDAMDYLTIFMFAGMAFAALLYLTVI